MAKSLQQIQKQIDALQREAQVARKREVGKVVERIRVAVEHYQLTPQDVFGGAAGKRRGRKPGSAAKRPAGRARKTVGRVKYRDESSGRGWTGHGRRPQWFVDALAAGKKAEDLAVK